jgi:hypothetical protein
MQVNLQIKISAANELVQIMSVNHLDLAFVLEPHSISNNPARIQNLLGYYVGGSRRNRSKLFPNSKETDVILTKLSDEDYIVA